MKWSIRRRAAAVSLAALAALLAGGIAYATIPDGNKVFTACMLKNVGTIRLIDPTLPSSNLMSHCSSLETPVSWNQQGQPGAPGRDGTDAATKAFARQADNVSLTSDPVLQIPLQPGSYTFTASLSLVDDSNSGGSAVVSCILWDLNGGQGIDRSKEIVPEFFGNTNPFAPKGEVSMALTGVATLQAPTGVGITCDHEANPVRVEHASLVATQVGSLG